VPENEVITEVNAWIEPNFSLIKHPMRVLDQKERKTRRHTVRMYKIQLSHHTEEEATCETEEYLNTKYLSFLQSRNCEFLLPTLFFLESNLGTRFRLRGVGCDAPVFLINLNGRSNLLTGVKSWSIWVLTSKTSPTNPNDPLDQVNPHLWSNFGQRHGQTPLKP
jgi:hypothetical protein